MKISIHNQLLLLSILIVAGNAILGETVYKSNQKLSSANHWVQHTEQVIDQSNKIYLTSRDIESSYRGYVIAKDSAFLISLNSSVKVIFVYLGQLKQLTRDNYLQQARVDSLVTNLRQLLTFSFKATALRRDKGLIPAVAYISGKEGKHYTAQIKLISGSITDAESRLLIQRKAAYDAELNVYHRFLLYILILLAFFTVLLLIITGKYLFQSSEKKKHAAELVIANRELSFQNEEKGKRAAELVVANEELVFQNDEKEKRASELTLANAKLSFQNDEKENRAAELAIANRELSYQNDEKENRAAELVIANKELLYQNDEKENRAAELVVANRELLYQNKEKENRAAELVIANKELVYQNTEKENRAAELVTANKELVYQNTEKENRAAELLVANVELSYQNNEKEKREIERAKMISDLTVRNKDLEQFAYIISHNLRAPIANIIGASSALEDSDLSIEDKEALNSGINKSIMKLDGVVQDLNHILEVKSDVNEHKELVRFSEMVDEIKISIKSLIEKYDVIVLHEFSAIDELLTLRPYLYSIFFNLISNSIKYRRQDIPCIIEIKSIKVKNDFKLIFTDNGMGIDLERYSADVFGLYKRFNNNLEGKGMGLYMVKTQVETLGGHIDIASAPNAGTTFTIEFAK